jgi:hypothetical protein
MTLAGGVATAPPPTANAGTFTVIASVLGVSPPARFSLTNDGAGENVEQSGPPRTGGLPL